MFVFWSVNAAASDWVRREYTLADEKGIPVVPVALDSTPMPTELSKFQGLPELATLLQSVQLAPGTDEKLRQTLKADEQGRLRYFADPGAFGVPIGEPILIDYDYQLPADVEAQVVELCLRTPVPVSQS
jgi:1-acyl-sn-glycerol-3-phosphate acyltransferase